MFNKRGDGKVSKGISNFDRIIPYVMDKRYDAQNFVTQNIPYKPLEEYLESKKAQGIKLSLMSLILAAYIRTVGAHPELNRFVVNRRIYDRNTVCVSFVVLRAKGETVAKVHFTGKETVFEIAEKLSTDIKSARDENGSTLVDSIIKTIFNLPFLPGFTVGLLKWLDNHNIMPKAVIDASPFHTSLFFTNLASIKMNSVYHHLYEFGTTSVFVSLGNRFNVVELDKENVPHNVEYCPLNITTDDRICSGAVYTRCFADFKRYMLHPELLES